VGMLVPAKLWCLVTLSLCGLMVGRQRDKQILPYRESAEGIIMVDNKL